jgi:predicted ester cyclase
MTEMERGLGSRWFEEVWNKGRRDAIPEMLAPDAVLHEAGTDSVGPEGFYPFFDRLSVALSDLHVTVHDTITENDRICVRWSCSAAHTGEGLGVAPTGKSIDVTGMSIMRVRDGWLVECWQNWDMLGLMEQIKSHAQSPTYVAFA